MTLVAALVGCGEGYNTRTIYITTPGDTDGPDPTIITNTVTLDGDCDYDAESNPTVCRLSGTLLEDARLSADVVWVLVGGFFVGDDVDQTVLTIDPGTKIVGDTVTRGYMVIRRNSRIEAVGTPDQPIVFTSANAEGERHRADWGGIVINGNAPLNTCDVVDPVTGFPDDKPAVDCEAYGEGASGYFGGTDPNDDSGTLEYVRVEFGGYPVTPNDELNGIAFQGVGNGTKVDHVQIHFGGDDAVEFFGGTVDVKHLVLTGTLDDAFDWTFGWTGRAQFVVAQMYSDVGNNGIEADNNEFNYDFLPRSSPVLSNFTLIGTSEAVTGNNDGVLLRRGTQAELHSFVMKNWNNAAGSVCFEVKDAQTVTQFTNGDLSIASSIVDCVVDLKDTNTTDVFTADASNLQVDPGLVNPTDLDDPDFAPMAGSPAESGGTTPSDPWFTPASYRGAVDPADNWVADGLASGWISLEKPNDF